MGKYIIEVSSNARKELQLKSGYWSRRINKKDRILYKVYEDKVLVLVVSAIGHYGDK